jgi:hypothetical protein
LNSRAVFLLLLVANLAFLAWATLIDRAPELPAPTGASRLPKLVLASEARSAARAAASASPAASAAAPTAAPPPGATNESQGGAGAAATGGSVAREDPAPGAPSTPAPAAAVNPTAPSVAPPPQAAAVAAPAHCVTVGPFNDLARAAQGADVLRKRGFSPRQRAEGGDAWSGYWVYIAGMASEAQQADVVRRLKRAGIDAQPLPASDGQRRVSAGIFNERQGADSRARAVRRLGFAVEVVERKQTTAAYWVDLDLATSNQTLPMEGLLALEESGARLEIRECPAPGTAVLARPGA